MTILPRTYIQSMQEQAAAEYLNTADLWRVGLATEEDVTQAAKFADQWDEMAENEPKDMPTYNDVEIGKIIRDRCCARCYGHLVQYPAPDNRWYAACPECSDTWHGAHVSKRTAEMIEQKAIEDYRDVVRNPALADVLPERRKYTEAEIMSQLGF